MPNGSIVTVLRYADCVKCFTMKKQQQKAEKVLSKLWEICKPKQKLLYAFAVLNINGKDLSAFFSHCFFWKQNNAPF